MTSRRRSLRGSTPPAFRAVHNPTCTATALVIDARTGMIAHGDAVVRKRGWFEFVALLGLRRTAPGGGDGVVDRDAVLTLPAWAEKNPTSVPKQIAAWIKTPIAKALVEARGATTRWRLAFDAEAVTFLPSRDEVAAALASATPVADARALDILEACCEAEIEIQQGRVEDAERRLDGYMPPSVARTDLDAWIIVLRARVALRTNDPDDVLADYPSRLSGRGARSVHAASVQVRAMAAMRNRTGGAEAIAYWEAALSRVESGIEARGDLVSIGHALNTLGNLRRRAGRFTAAMQDHLRAACYAGVAANMSLLQAALFNLGLDHLQASGDGPSPAAARRLVRLSERVMGEFHVGRDSALTELVLARFALEDGNLVIADAFLMRGRGILAGLPNDHEEAYYHRVCSKRHLLARDLTRGIQELERAVDFYKRVGERERVAQLQGELRDLRDLL